MESQSRPVSEVDTLPEDPQTACLPLGGLAALLRGAVQGIMSRWPAVAPEQPTAADDCIVVPWCCG
jgi:hypothetical protein